eukprot:TRINITY_DN29221_c0_g1_i1.p1 TRINITY_DN29221_c0_g1~~TRINITY_DN29221_c0_g1_i1.p1  ORF type:complete len:341 (-),score=54.77 TRINITY_DN29221_c0_g1_i1:96-1118(-)
MQHGVEMGGDATAALSNEFPVLADFLGDGDLADMSPQILSQKLELLQRGNLEDLAEQLFLVLKRSEGRLVELRRESAAAGPPPRGGTNGVGKPPAYGNPRARSHEAGSLQRHQGRGGSAGSAGYPPQRAAAAAGAGRGRPDVTARPAPAVSPTTVSADPGYSVLVTVIHATGLKHLNFLGDAPYCVCEVKHMDQKTTPSSFRTQTVSKSLDPVWNETHELNNWHPGEALEFIIYDKGLIGARTEGRCSLPSSLFYPHGFEGEIPLHGLLEASVYVRVIPTYDSQSDTQEQHGGQHHAQAQHQQDGQNDVFDRLYHQAREQRVRRVVSAEIGTNCETRSHR